MELVTVDALETVSQRAYTAFRRIGRVKEYNAESFVTGKIYIDGWPAEVRVEWLTCRDSDKVQLDIAATSNDNLNRAADEAMYKFASAFKAVEPGDYIKPGSPPVALIATLTLAALALLIFVAFAFHLPPFSG